tara:strand:+ start:722 stop:1888 length:1167 start_codon:yes stop_codon:yes gene_type:complete
MATGIIWPGSGSLTEAEDTPFKFYTTDSEYVSHSVQTATWCAKRLGYPIMDVELEGKQMYACFEEAVTEYSTIVNQYNIKENIMKLQGAPTSSNFTHTVVSDLGRAITVSENYGQEAGVGGSVDWKMGSVTVNSGSQVYDLNDWASKNEENKAIEIKRVFHEGTPAIARYFDPYAGTGTGYQNMLDGFGFGGDSPAITFTMMPINADILRTQAIELNDQIRKSSYSFELINNKLRLFPIPTSEYKVYFQYILKEDRWKTLTSQATGSTEGGYSGVQSDFSNIRYDNMTYKEINDPGQQWIRKYTLALCKELLGIVRSKYGSIPIPGSETNMDGDTLRSEATAEKEALVSTLREMLEQSTSNEIMEEEAQEAEHTQEILKKVPLKIYIG